jgi:hypothetical protein
MAVTPNSSGYIASAEITVFPCANRGLNQNYSQLLTEYNLTHLSGVTGHFDTYIIKDITTSTSDAIKFIAVIGGYLFIIPKGLDSAYSYISIKVGDGETGIAQSDVLIRCDSTESSTLDSDETFYGAFFSTGAPAIDAGYSYTLNRTTDKSAIARYDNNKRQLILN